MAHAQDSGPMAPPPKFEAKRIPSVPHPGPPPIPAEQIIQKFAANEDIMKKEFAAYDFTQTVRLQELMDGGGQFTATGLVYARSDGQHYWRIAEKPVSTLTVKDYSLTEVRMMMEFPAFVFTTDEIANYNFMYAGQDKLDELNTYVFQVKPKTLSRTRRYFQGAIWVDDQDFAIVKTYGKMVSEMQDDPTQHPLSMFETYRENFQGKYWLPTYTTSEDYVGDSADSQIHLRLIVHDTDFKIRPPAGPTPDSASSPPASPNSPAPRN